MDRSEEGTSPMRTGMALVCVGILGASQVRADDSPLPKVAKGWAIEVIAKAPEIAYPTAVVVARDGTIYLGQDPMDMPGPPTSPIDSVVSIRGGKVSTFAEGLWSVMGLEWSEGTLYVVHAPFLSSFRDLDGDGKADERVDLITGLGPNPPGFNGINDHVASGLRLGMDGFLYIAVGDKGIPRGVGRDGTVVMMSTGGVIRIRPDGSGLELVSTGERNPLSVALTDRDEIFTLGNDDDSKKWPNSLTHHIVGGHHGYPYEFLTATDRALPIVHGQFGGAGAQGLAYHEDGLPDRYRGNLIFCDWGLQAVHRFEVAPSGGTFRLVGSELLVEKGDLKDFRPFSIATNPDGSSFTLVDWAYNGWLSDGPKTGRIYRLSYVGADRVTPSPRPLGTSLADRIVGLSHPALAIRLDAQHSLIAMGTEAVPGLIARLRSGSSIGRVHALWALDAIKSSEARQAIRSAVGDTDPAVRLQAVRSSGIRRDLEARPGLTRSLADPDPVVRREAAIALGRLGEPASGPALVAALGETDIFAAWSIRRAIKTLNAWDLASVSSSLADPKRRENALKLTDQSWSVVAVRALNASMVGSTDPAWRARVVSTLANQYRRDPEWSGLWFGTNPLAGPRPIPTRDWDRPGMDAVLVGLAQGLRDADPLVRRPAIVGLFGVGERASPLLRATLVGEADPTNQAAIARALGLLNDLPAAPGLARVLADRAKPLEVRMAGLESLARLNSPVALKARMALAFDDQAPAELIARVLPGLGRSRVLPANDLAPFLEKPSDLIRAAALRSFPIQKPLSVDIREQFVARLDDPSIEVRRAAIEGAETHKIHEAVPRLAKLALDESYRAEATRALAAMPDPRAIDAFVAALKDRDPALRQTGESALVAIRDVARANLTAEVKKGGFVGPSAMAVERILTSFQPVVDWRVIGPFPRTTANLFGVAARIDVNQSIDGADGRKVAWQPRRADDPSGRVDLDDLKGKAGDRGGFGYDRSNSADLAAFGMAEVVSDRDRAALMLIGSSGPVMVSINDQWVLNREDATDRGATRIKLRKGANSILVRTREGVGAWSFSLQVSVPSDDLAGAISVSSEGLRAFATGHGGDPKQGEAIFFDAKGVGCARCHAVGGQGTPGVGPDLTGLAAKYDKSEVIRSILEPSSRIANGYQPVILGLRNGSVLSGVVRSETVQDLNLINDEGRAVRVSKAEIDQRKVGDRSTMPTGLVEGLSPVDFADLVAYLMTLK